MYIIVGFKFLNFKDDKGNDVVGYKIHLLSDQDDPELDAGQTALNKFFSARSITGIPRVGAACDFKITLSGTTPKISGLVIYDDKKGEN